MRHYAWQRVEVCGATLTIHNHNGVQGVTESGCEVSYRCLRDPGHEGDHRSTRTSTFVGPVRTTWGQGETERWTGSLGEYARKRREREIADYNARRSARAS